LPLSAKLALSKQRLIYSAGWLSTDNISPATQPDGDLPTSLSNLRIAAL